MSRAQMPSVCSQCGAFAVSSSNDFELNLTTLARFAHLSATNEPPRDAELPLIRSIVQKTSARLASLDAEICRLKGRLSELEEERTALSVYLAQNRKILSPLRRMPPEILGEIFSWSQPSDHHPTFSTKNCHWVLTYICSAWRAVALSKPSLWSIIQVSFSRGQRYPLEMVKVQIERARELDINFLGSQNVDSAPQIAMFSLLSQYSSRWAFLSIQLTPTDDAPE
ncbi:F-box domain-containing protein [Mycena sanguinolenta]|uniref:F-box domain-containing protein n=1 Tax=Mycena sanguinolenta TaxID=230812 RepID=A0A8H7CPA9_9AGAR|nr:F-box domain-containing protein [Mycena sanguinolenta]